MLIDTAPHAGTAAEAAALGARLGGLPLVLDTAGLYLASLTSRHTTFTVYQHALDNQFSDLLGAAHPQAGDPDIARTVVHRDGHIPARPLLQLLALLEPALIPRTLITPGLLTEATRQHVTTAETDSALAGLHQYRLLNTLDKALHHAGASTEAHQLDQHIHAGETRVSVPTTPTPSPAAATTTVTTTAVVTARVPSRPGERSRCPRRRGRVDPSAGLDGGVDVQVDQVPNDGDQLVGVALGEHEVPGALVGFVRAVRGEQQTAGAGDLPGAIRSGARSGMKRQASSKTRSSGWCVILTVWPFVTSTM
ncbi:hypothetical protein ACFQ9U_32610 [Streptomyces sp. NPDC056568]|uniref:hypothetical protein n=1 Tax=Streptomyces sp. NPDC056568 TaxID=3345866 RepID=UPI0036CEF309